MPRILLVKTSSMGDIVHNMPLIADIRKIYPDAIFDWVVEESFMEIAALNSLVSNFIPVTMRRWKKAPFSKQTWREFFTFKRALKLHAYDVILDTQGLLKSALICRWAQGTSHGADFHTAREPWAGLLYNYGHEVPSNLHAAVRNRMLGALALGYALPETPPVYDLNIPRLNLSLDLPSDYVMCLHSTARDAKLWPVEHWITLGKYLASQNQSMLLPWGNKIEQERAELIASSVPNALVLPKMRLTDLASITAKAKAAIGLDTGLMHLAVAMDIPTLAIFTDTYIWQAGVYPATTGCATTIGGKGVTPSADEAIQAFIRIRAEPASTLGQ
jgi:heptosyltransferase-1